MQQLLQVICSAPGGRPGGVAAPRSPDRMKLPQLAAAIGVLRSFGRVNRMYNEYAPSAADLICAADFLKVGTWLSLVEHSLGVRGVGSSNLPVPTITPAISRQLAALSPPTQEAPQFRKRRSQRRRAEKSVRGDASAKHEPAAVQICPSRPKPQPSAVSFQLFRRRPTKHPNSESAAA
jgi:hypothetical protein